MTDSPALPARRHSSVKAFLLGFVATFFPIFDVPVFWPILLLYWLVLLFVTMRRQIKHMIKYRYVPFSWGKKVSGNSRHRGLAAVLCRICAVQRVQVTSNGAVQHADLFCLCLTQLQAMVHGTLLIVAAAWSVCAPSPLQATPRHSACSAPCRRIEEKTQ